MMKAVLAEENPYVQNAVGKLSVLAWPAATDAGHSAPPFLHSQSISSFL